MGGAVFHWANAEKSKACAGLPFAGKGNGARPSPLRSPGFARPDSALFGLPAREAATSLSSPSQRRERFCISAQPLIHHDQKLIVAAGTLFQPCVLLEKISIQNCWHPAEAGES